MEPNTPDTVDTMFPGQVAQTPKFLLRLPADLRERLERIAERQHRSLTNLILHALTQYAEREEKRQNHGK